MMVRLAMIPQIHEDYVSVLRYRVIQYKLAPCPASAKQPMQKDKRVSFGDGFYLSLRDLAHLTVIHGGDSEPI